jgi:hypothetical protein
VDPSPKRGPKVRYRIRERLSPEAAARAREEQPTEKHVFSAVISQSLAMDNNRPVHFLDLDSGKRVTPPPGLDQDAAALNAWMARNGLDVLPEASGESTSLRGADIRVIPVTSEAWTDLPATAVAELAAHGPLWSTRLMRTGSFWPSHYPTRPVSPEEARQWTWPDTYLFRTREGGQGIMQIASATGYPPGLRIRYKLVQLK